MSAPSFSIVLEIDDLDFVVDAIPRLRRSLESLARQDFAITSASAVLLAVEERERPELAAVLREFPWVTVFRRTPGTRHYETKMEAARTTRGDVVILCDADCVFEASWLRSLLAPFADPAVDVVGGETQTERAGAYGTAMTLAYIFQPWTGRAAPYPGRRYAANNVAFRRSLLERHEIPRDLPVHRGNCALHAVQLANAGVRIWIQPLSRATHPAPHGVAHFVWRFWLLGRDWTRLSALVVTERQHQRAGRAATSREAFNALLRRRQDLAVRLAVVRTHSIGRRLAAVPIVLAASALFAAGAVWGLCVPAIRSRAACTPAPVLPEREAREQTGY